MPVSLPKTAKRPAKPSGKRNPRRHPRPPAAHEAAVFGAAEHAAVLDLTHTLFATLDLGGRVCSCSGAWEDCLHRPRGEIVGHPLLDFVHPADRNLCRSGLQRTLAGHPSEEFAVRFAANGRGAVWLSIRPAVNASRDALHMVARDVTGERLAAEHPLRADLALEELEEAVLVADATLPEQPIFHANSALLRLTGYSATEVSNRPLTFLAGPATDMRAMQEALASAMRGERVVTEVCYHRKDGSPVWVRLHLRPVTGGEGAVRQIIAVLLDVSERRLVFDALREKNQALTEALESLQKNKEAIVQRERMHALGKMASGIVHDFNNLLAPILGFTELLLSVPDLMQDPTRVATYLQKIRTAANDGAAVVARLREFYRGRAEGEPPVEFCVQKAVEEVLDLTRHRWRNEAHANGHEIKISADLQETPPVFGCASEIRQALTNLVLNAIDAMPKGGTLRLATYPVGKWICIQVADTGAGMSEEVRQRCFEPFFTTKGKAGTGLGLAIVFGIVERHRGRVELQSEEGRGTCFTLWLPAGVPGNEAGAAQMLPAAASGRPLHVMVVDDEDLLLEVVSQHLLNMGHSVDCFTDPKAAIEQFYKNPYDLVITDRAMPGMTGDQLARLVREYKSETPVILLTGFGNIIRQSGETLENIDEVLSKPLSQQTLRDVVARYGPRAAPEPVSLVREA